MKLYSLWAVSQDFFLEFTLLGTTGNTSKNDPYRLSVIWKQKGQSTAPVFSW
ncbi:hypothetical protein SAMN04488057_12110 [Cyclobacterium lianum]|uniref:Uncharacterized protein n=1 Tax=Cyclobacterium lianum TaxID=388280 RepID=A0A1M7QNQ4_9BACT|nr:hypothetical protein SAMN04488057_12110 [Cyclobacterium lianum]